MNETVLIFDFDGTIADTHHYIVKISNRLAHEFNYNIIDREEIEALRDKTAKEIIRHLKVPVLKIPAILARAKKELRKEISEIQPITGLRDVLHQLRGLGMLMGILSSNATENIAKFLENHGLRIFDFIRNPKRLRHRDDYIRLADGPATHRPVNRRRCVGGDASARARFP